MKKFIIHTNTDKDPDNKITDSVISALESFGATIVKDGNDADALIALGGDGTLLRAMHKNPHIPILGINLGTLGFLTEFEADDLESLKKVAHGDYIIEQRMMLEGTIDGGEPFYALNDIVLNRGGFTRIMTMKLYVDGALADTYSADGIISSTPTGSTAYSLSAGGPVVEPDIELIEITPICPHSMRSRSLMVSHRRIVEIELLKKEDAKMQVCADGMSICDISGGSKVRIKRAGMNAGFIRLKNRSFYDILNKKQELR